MEKELAKLGHPLSYQKISNMDFYPVGLRALSLLVIKGIFDFDNEKIRDAILQVGWLSRSDKLPFNKIPTM